MATTSVCVSPVVRQLRCCGCRGDRPTALLIASSCSWHWARRPRWCAAAGCVRFRHDRHPAKAGPPISCTNGRPNARPHVLPIARSSLSSHRVSPMSRSRMPSCVDHAQASAGGEQPRTYRGALSRRTADVTPPIEGSASTVTNGNLEIRVHRQRRRCRLTAIRSTPGPWADASSQTPGSVRRRRQQRRHHQPDDLATTQSLSAAGYLCWSGKDTCQPSRLDGRRSGPTPLRSFARTCGTGRRPTPTDTPLNHSRGRASPS